MVEKSEKTFRASRYLTKLDGKDYLEVKWRLLWLRTEHPDAVIATELVKHEVGMALFKARITLPDGGEATGWGSETINDFGDYIEKAETKALGRACAALGYGTQFCEDFDFHEKPVDAAVKGRGSARSVATAAQLKAIYIIAQEEHGLTEEQVNRHAKKVYGRLPSELTKQEASKLIDRLKGKASGD